MSTTLDPRIAEKLDAFAHRRRRLIIFRGVCASVAVLLAAMMLVALVDWLFVLPDAVRWSLSAAAYLAVLIVAWRVCGRLLLRVPDARRLAVLIEGADPSLREQLLSAVELGQGDGALDSQQFRALVQAEVSMRVTHLEVEQLLPTMLLRTVVATLAIVVALCVIALVTPSLRFGALLVRALAPGANLDRVSSVQVKIIQPAPASLSVPQGDSVPLLVELSGRRVDKAFLETFTKSGGRSVVQLQPAPGGRYSAGIQVAREDVEYRVRAFDAITRKYKLQAAARPSVVSFHKEYRYPKYTGFAPKIVDEENGDLAGLEGTEVDLAIQTNQPVKLAVLSVEGNKAGPSAKAREVPLVAGKDGRMTVKLPLEGPGFYRVELVSAETGFENKFSPEYELRVMPDTIPQVNLATPERDLIASSNEIISLTATATDDVGLERVEQMVRINDGLWSTRLLSQEKARAVKIDSHWDLFQQGVRPGDIVTTKLVATDCKFNRGESRPVAITIAASGFDRTRLETLAAERELMTAVAKWQDATEKLERRHGDLRGLIESTPAAEAAPRGAALAEFATAIIECSELAAAIQAHIVTTIRLATPGHETANLVLLSRIVAQGEALLRFLPRQIQTAGADPMPEMARELSRNSNETCQWIKRRGQQAEDGLAKLLTAEEIDVINENLQVIVREQKRLAELAQRSGENPAKWLAVAGRMKVVLAEVASTEEALKGAAGTNRTGVADRLERVRKKLAEQRGAALPALDEVVPTRSLLTPALNLARATTEGAQTLLDVKRDHDNHAVGAVQQWSEQVEPSWSGFEKLRQEVEEMLRPEKFPAELRGDLASGRWDARLGVWKAYGDVEELRPDADAPFVKDVRSLRLALDALRQELVTPGASSAREDWWKRVGALDQSYRVLEAAHDLTQLANGFDLLATAERYQAGGLHARTSNVSDFQRLWQRLRAADNDLGRTNLKDQEKRKRMQEAKSLLIKIPGDPAARALEEEMKQRLKSDREITAMNSQAEQVAAQVRQALDLLRPAVDDARNVLKAATPKLAERMAQLSKEAQELQRKNAEHAEEKAEKPAEQTKAEARQSLAQQQQLNEKIDTVKDALRADANLQDVMEKEGRERARDADDALAMLKDPPARAEQALDEAAKAERSSEQKAATKAASQEDQKLADALDQIAQHYDALEKGEAEKTRMALREEEKKLGVKDDLDHQFAKAEDLAKTAQATPQGMLEKLEKALPKNPLMRQELSSVSRDLLQKAGEQLAAATKQESEVARQVEKLAGEPPGTSPAPAPEPRLISQPGAGKMAAALRAMENTPVNPALANAVEQQTPIAQNANEAGQSVERAGRHEERLKNEKTGQQLQRLGTDTQATAQREIPKAQQALTEAAAAAQAKEAVGAAELGLKEKVARLAMAQNGAEPEGKPETAKAEGASPADGGKGNPSPTSTQSKPGQPSALMTSETAPADEASPMQVAEGGQPGSPQQQVWMARALDSLDAALHAQNNNNAQPQQGGKGDQKPQQGQGQKQEGSSQRQEGKEAAQQAQKAMAQASQAQAAEMRANRSPTPPGQPNADVAKGGQLAASKTGARADANGTAYGQLPRNGSAAQGTWGKLPKQMAEQLSQGSREAVSAEYQKEVETYYRVIAERAQKEGK